MKSNIDIMKNDFYLDPKETVIIMDGSRLHSNYLMLECYLSENINVIVLPPNSSM